LEALVDFPDDALYSPVPITAAHIDAMMRRLAECGVRRVSWAGYADGHGGFLTPDHDPQWRNLAQTYQVLGQNTTAVAVEAAHRHGLEVYAYFKPYETGPAAVFPEGSYEGMVYGRLTVIGGRMTWIDPFVADHPHLRIKRSSEIPHCVRNDSEVVRNESEEFRIDNAPICSLKLRKRDDLPTRLTTPPRTPDKSVGPTLAEDSSGGIDRSSHLQIWVSDLNYQYRRLDVPFTTAESIEPCPRDVYDLFSDSLLVAKGEPQRVITLSGFEITDRYVLVTTDFTEGPADFDNTDLGMLSAFDSNGQEIVGVIASGTDIWFADMVDFRNWGLGFDTGYNGQLMCLDEPNTSGKKGFVAFARGRNDYLPGALCETEPEVQAFWLRCIDGLLDAGVDGIDFREENHSTHTNHPEEYGFNEVVLEKCRERGQVDLPTIAAVRGDAYTEFLAKAKKQINARGKSMRINFQIDWYRPNPARCRKLAYPMNLDFQWQRWIEEGLTDEAVLRFYELPFDCVFDDEVAQEMIERCRQKNIPVTVNRYIRPDTLEDEYRCVVQDGRFAGFILYETCSFMKFTADGGCNVTMPEVEALKETIV